ncbi:MAG TPA: MotA/TolQ/ExbB proton channel family protein [Chthoniobacteraceae bacterium]|jgi:biopolymer transport protein ExbB|nr:MotA/TolQ/ExbB proton channel family protein [Chthoniobacteraceae bacterium]
MKLRNLYLLSLLMAALLAIAGGLQAQQESAAAAEGAKPLVHNKTLMEQIKEGGWVMFPIFAVSILMVYLIADGVLRTGAKKALPAEQVESVRSFFRQGDYVGAYNFCKANPSPFTNVCRVAISLLGEGKVVVEDGIVAEVAKENSRMQTYISYLSVIGVCAPMLGLLGTVTGMMGAFAVLGSTGIGDPSTLSAKIGEVLTATASGLFIAIPAFGAFYFLRNRAAKVLHDIQDTMAGLLRKMPYDQLAGAHIGDEELYAAPPNWLTAPAVAANLNA